MQAYSLSKFFSPPQVDLREARLIDDHGAMQNSAVSVRHRDPNDVSVKELEYYFDVWGFMTPGDLLFYAYPLTRFNDGDGEPPLYFERWFETLDDKFDSVLQLCSDAQRATLRALLARFSNYARNLDFARVVQFTECPGRITPQCTESLSDAFSNGQSTAQGPVIVSVMPLVSGRTRCQETR